MNKLGVVVYLEHTHLKSLLLFRLERRSLALGENILIISSTRQDTLLLIKVETIIISCADLIRNKKKVKICGSQFESSLLLLVMSAIFEICPTYIQPF